MGKEIGLIAGDGDLPILFAKKAQQQGIDVTAIAVTPSTKIGKLADLVKQLYQVNVGQLDKIISTLLDEEIKEVVMLGKVTKELLFQGIELDQRFMKLLSSLREKNDDAIMNALVDELASEGVKVNNQQDLISNLFPAPGLLTTDGISDDIIKDMEYGFKMAKEIAGIDIGQTVVVKDQAVMAVEAIEGTDQAILRGGKLGCGGVVAAKVSKPEQDIRFDIPTIGLETIDSLIEAEASGLVIEAGKVFVIEQEKVVEKAEEHGISILAMNEGESLNG